MQLPIPPDESGTEDSNAWHQATDRCYRQLFNSLREGVLILDWSTSRIVDANAYMAELLGYAREDFLGRALWEFGILRDGDAGAATFRELQEKDSVSYA